MFFLIIVEGMAFTVRTTKNKFPYCVTAQGDHIHSTECNAIYASLAFAGVNLLLAFLSAISVTLVIQCHVRRRYKNRCNIQRISCPGEPVNQVEGGEESG